MTGTCSAEQSPPAATRQVRMTLGYHGAQFAGWGVQNRGQRTVQATVEAALERALEHPVRTSVAGRTDAGVHADGQVVSFPTSSALPTAALGRALERWLPTDVWVIEATDVQPDFDARRSARARWYTYSVWLGSVPAAAWHGRALAHVGTLDFGLMRRAAHALLGRRDFGAFAARPLVGSTERTILAADWLRADRLAHFEICADAFLKQMVRTIVGSLLWVGSGRWSPTEFASALATTDRRAVGPTAPAHGLTLARIEY